MAQQGEQAATDILSAAPALAPLIHASRESMEAERRLPAPVVAALRKLGAFRLAIPRAYGGLELDPVTQVKVVEELSRLGVR